MSMDEKTARNIQGPLRVEGHGRPVTRREFLAQGFLTGSAAVTLPGILGLFANARVANAQGACGVGFGGPQKIPFIGFDLAGGANIAGSNVLVGRDSQLAELSLDGYEILGLPAEFTPQQLGPAVFNDEFGILFHEDSAMPRGRPKLTARE